MFAACQPEEVLRSATSLWEIFEIASYLFLSSNPLALLAQSSATGYLREKVDDDAYFGESFVVFISRLGSIVDNQ